MNCSQSAKALYDLEDLLEEMQTEARRGGETGDHVILRKSNSEFKSQQRPSSDTLGAAIMMRSEEDSSCYADCGCPECLSTRGNTIAPGDLIKRDNDLSLHFMNCDQAKFKISDLVLRSEILLVTGLHSEEFCVKHVVCIRARDSSVGIIDACRSKKI